MFVICSRMVGICWQMVVKCWKNGCKLLENDCNSLENGFGCCWKTLPNRQCWEISWKWTYIDLFSQGSSLLRSIEWRTNFTNAVPAIVNKIAYSKPNTNWTVAPLARVRSYAYQIAKLSARLKIPKSVIIRILNKNVITGDRSMKSTRSSHSQWNPWIIIFFILTLLFKTSNWAKIC